MISCKWREKVVHNQDIDWKNGQKVLWTDTGSIVRSDTARISFIVEKLLKTEKISDSQDLKHL